MSGRIVAMVLLAMTMILPAVGAVAQSAPAQADCGGADPETGVAADCGGAAPVTGGDPAILIPGRDARFRICAEQERWGTSAEYLRRTARCVQEGSASDQDALRLTMIDDIYIKSWSYAIINKLFFWFSILLATLVLCWPALGAILKPADPPDGEEAPAPSRLQRALGAPSVQTSITALAAFCFAFYAHYKDKQAISETLMRSILYAETIDRALISDVVGQMAEMDKGFGFATSAKPPP